jgi:hypothetical protein
VWVDSSVDSDCVRRCADSLCKQADQIKVSSR